MRGRITSAIILAILLMPMALAEPSSVSRKRCADELTPWPADADPRVVARKQRDTQSDFRAMGGRHRARAARSPSGARARHLPHPAPPAARRHAGGV